jgi:hypothetical protein
MTFRRTAALCAVGAVVAWGLKAVAIAVAGGLDRSPLEGPFFFLGLGLLVAAFVAAGLALTEGRKVAARILGTVGALVVGIAVSGLVERSVGALVPDSAGWVQEEAGLWAISTITAVAMLIWWTTQRRNASTSDLSRSA